MASQRKWYSLADKVWNPANLALAAAAVRFNPQWLDKTRESTDCQPVSR